MRVATDGSCLKNPGGKTGWAWVAEDGRWQSGSVAVGSNNIAELMAAIAALKAHRKVAKLHLEIDSQYVLNIIQKWGAGWKRRGWKKANGEPVANAKLVSMLMEESARQGLTMEWVKGHNGHWLNEFADEQAGLAARGQTPVTRGNYTEEQIAAQMLADVKPKLRDRRTASGFKPPKSTAKKIPEKSANAKSGTDASLEREADLILRGDEKRKAAARRHRSVPRTAGGKKRPKRKKD